MYFISITTSLFSGKRLERDYLLCQELFLFIYFYRFGQRFSQIVKRKEGLYTLL